MKLTLMVVVVCGVVAIVLWVAIDLLKGLQGKKGEGRDSRGHVRALFLPC